MWVVITLPLCDVYGPFRSRADAQAFADFIKAFQDEELVNVCGVLIRRVERVTL